MQILGFDGSNYDCYDFSGISGNYRHFIILKSVMLNSRYLFVFNNTLDISYSGEKNRKIICDNGDINFYYFSRNGSEWSLVTNDSTSLTTKNSVIIYSDLTQLSDSLLNNKEIHYVHEDVPVPVAYVVSNSVKDVNFGNVFTDIFDILPVVLSMLVSLVAIRKGISYMRKILVMS